MPAYLVSPLDGVPSMLLPGVPGFSFGSQAQDTPATRMLVTSVAITSNVATVGVTMVEGLIPVVGALISIRGTQTATSGGAPNFNVSNAAITAVSINSTTGIGTVSFALTSSNITTTTDSGEALVPVPEVAELIAANTSYLQFTSQSKSGSPPDQGRVVTWATDFVTCVGAAAPATISITLQGAIRDVNGEYEILDTSTNTSGETRTVANINHPFLRVATTTLTGTTPKGTCKILA